MTALADGHLYSLEKEPFVLALTGHASASHVAGDMATRRLDEIGALETGAKHASS